MVRKNILNSNANIAMKVDIGVHFILKHIKLRIVEYQHIVCGLKIGKGDYAVHPLVAGDHKGNRYYDHSLTKK